MTREEIIELQKVHSDIYKEKIDPLLNEIEKLKAELVSEFRAALENYFDTLFTDKNGISIQKDSVFEVLLYEIWIMWQGEQHTVWRHELDINNYILGGYELEKTGLTRKLQYKCTSRKVQFIFGDMLHNEQLSASPIRNGKVLKREETFKHKECKYFEIIEN